MAGKLVVPANAGVVAICTDPVVQNVLNEDLRAARHGLASNPENSVTLTVTVNQQLLAPGVSLNQMFPGDPSMVELLKAAGANPPPLGDSGNQPIDPFAQEARRRVVVSRRYGCGTVQSLPGESAGVARRQRADAI